MIKLGGHLKASEGLAYVTAAARALSYNEVQIMLGGSRDYSPYDFDEASVMEFRKNSFGMNVTVHLPYTINPCESTAQRRAFYTKTFLEFTETAKSIGATKLVMHPGFKKEMAEEEARQNLMAFIEKVWDPEGLELLLETDSGSKNGSAVGSASFIRRVIEDMALPSLGMCVDTEHLYARGHSLWDEETRKDFLRVHGSYIKLVHLNSPDPEVTLGSNKDRHNTPFSMRPDLKSEPMIKDLARYPMILERTSLQVQREDSQYVREVLGLSNERQRA